MGRNRARLGLSWGFLRASAAVAVLGVAACVAEPGGVRQAGPQGSAFGVGGPPQSTATRIAILLPLTGPTSEVGQAMLRGAQMALDAQQGAPGLDTQDTKGTAEGAAAAAQAALAGGAGIILGPLTAAETNAVAPIARAAGTPVLAFTSDATLAQPGVWPMGITPAQQVGRLVQAVQADNKMRLAAVVPSNIFGEALANGLGAATAAAGMPAAAIVRAPGTFAGFNDALKTVSDYAARKPAIDAQQKAAKDALAAGAAPAAPGDSGQGAPGLPFDALLLGATGSLLGQVAPLLDTYDIGPARVRLLGPATWAREAVRLPALAGAWYAAPETKQRAGFEQRYNARFHTAPNDFSSLAFDAAGIARSAASPQGFPVAALTRVQGYAGVDGPVALQPGGVVRRGLAIYEVGRGSARLVQPAPSTLAAPGS